jgi:NAD(P)-dependent dehydrogenase (short-subunit alcohol dehydrogenase family)
VAPFVTFLASAHAEWVTGQTVSVSGGYTTVG